MFLGLLRQFIFLIPLVLILPRLFGLTGVWIATPIADGLAVVVSLIVLFIDIRKNKREDSLLGNTSFDVATETA
jgi:Na+-driven multidrug efflux pump